MLIEALGFYLKLKLILLRGDQKQLAQVPRSQVGTEHLLSNIDEKQP